MTTQAPEWYVTQYRDRAMHIYQQRGNKLRGMVTPAGRIDGAEKAIFWLAGKSVAYKKIRNQTNIPSNAGRQKFEAPLVTWTAFETIEEFDLDRMNVDEREIVYQSGAMALGRATDIELYAKMAAAVPAITTGLDFTAAESFEAGHALTICKSLQDMHVPWDGQTFCGLPSLLWNQFLGNKVVNSSQHVGRDDLPFMKATDSRFWNGVNWFLLVEDTAEDLYPIPASNEYDIFAWHKSAMGWANHTDMNLRIQWDNTEDYWTVNMKVKGAATTLQEGNGIVRASFQSDTPVIIRDESLDVLV